MKFAGIDIGSLTGKAVVLENDEILAYKIINVKRNPILTSKLVYTACLDQIGLLPEDIDYCVGTGYGREKIPFVQKSISEISCHGLGAFKIDPIIRTIIDIGGQDCKVIIVDSNGDLVDFIMNDKCAAGTGRYLEIMADLLDLSLGELGTIGLKSNSPVSINSNCSIYAQTEVLRYISKKTKINDIAAGINQAMAKRVMLLTQKLAGKMKPAYVLTGGVAKNRMVAAELEKLLQIQFKSLSVDPQIIGALGAAYFAKQTRESEG